MSSILVRQLIKEFFLLEKTGSPKEDSFRENFLNFATDPRDSSGEPLPGLGQLPMPKKIETYGALNRGGLTAHPQGLGSARQFKVSRSAPWAAALSAYVDSIGGSYTNLGKGVHRSGYETHRVSIDGVSFYYIFDDLSARSKKGLLDNKNLGKAAEYAIAAAMNSLISKGNWKVITSDDDQILIEFFNKFLDETPEGKKVTAASADEQAEFQNAFNNMTRAVLGTLIGSSVTSPGRGEFPGATVDTVRDAIADIKSDKADVHVKLNSRRLGGIHRMAEIPDPEGGAPIELIDDTSASPTGDEIVRGRSTDIYERVFDDILKSPANYGVKIPQQIYRLKKDKRRDYIKNSYRGAALDALEQRGYITQLEKDMSSVLETGSRNDRDTYYISVTGNPTSGFAAKVEKINLGTLVGGIKVVRNAPVNKSPDGTDLPGVPKTTHLYKVVNAAQVGDFGPGELELITIEYRGDRKPQMHRGDDFSRLTEARAGKNAKLTEATLRCVIREALLAEELTKTDKKEIEKLSRKQAKKEIEASIGQSFVGTPGKIRGFVEDMVRKEVAKILKDKSTKDATADIVKKILKNFYKEVSVKTNTIDRIKI